MPIKLGGRLSVANYLAPNRINTALIPLADKNGRLAKVGRKDGPGVQSRRAE